MLRSARLSGAQWPSRAYVVRIALVLAASLGVAAMVIALLAFRELRRALPPVDQLAGYRPAVASQIYAANGELLSEFFLEKRYLVALDKIPRVVRQAFVAAEDANFYHHSGVDFGSITRAFLMNMLAGEVVQGGSTITQQVVKSLLLTPEKSYTRKLKEIMLSMRLERQFSKDEILYIYLNQIY
ncbi:MAG: transglycosylase domain-containing protein, partial [Candidatus Binatia bacterium]